MYLNVFGYKGKTYYTNGNGHLYIDKKCSKMAFRKTKDGYVKSVTENLHIEQTTEKAQETKEETPQDTEKTPSYNKHSERRSSRK